MMIAKMAKFVVLMVWYSLSHQQTKGAFISEQDLITKLLESYDRRAFPLTDSTEPMAIQVDFYLNQIQSLDGKTQTLTAVGTINMRWTDPKLVWYGLGQTGRNFIELNGEDIWLPSATLANSVHEDNEIVNPKALKVKLWNYGVALITIRRLFRTFCPMNLRYFPFDSHVCNLTLMHGIRFKNQQGNITLEEAGIDFVVGSNELDYFLQNDEWDIQSITVNNISQIGYMSPYKFTFPTVTACVKLRRKPTFFVIILVIPSLLVGCISVVGFLLPSESGEKVSLQLTALLSYVFLFLLVIDIIPPVGGNFPLIAQILIGGQMLSTVNLMVIVAILRVYHNNGQSPVPRWAHILVFKIIGTLTCSRGAKKIQGSSVKKIAPDCADNMDNLYIEEWQAMSKILGNFMFILNIVALLIEVAYGYTTLFTHQ